MISDAGRRALSDALGDRVRFDVPMSKHISLRVGGPADAFATPEDRAELQAALSVCAQHDIPHAVVGAGFNLLVRDGGVDGLMVSLRRLRSLEARAEGVFCEAGVSHSQLTRFCVERGFAGLEFAAGIPGTIGGWVAMNAGIGSREIKDVLVELELVDPRGESIQTLKRAEVDFVYRSLRGVEPASVVVSAVFAVTQSESEAVRAEVDQLLARRAETQPLNVPSCGSVFKNPEDDFAGRLIEAAGLKGEREGGAQITPLHANFIANTGGARASDVLRLIERAQRQVERHSGSHLEPEVRIIGREA